MNRHLGLFSLAVLHTIVMCAATAPTVRAQAVPPPAAPAAPAAGGIDASKGSENVATAVPQITAWINAQVKTLASGEPAQAADARNQMIDAVSPGRVKPTAAFLAEFARQLDAAIAPALKHESDLVRLNAAIVVARTAERADNAALRGAAMTLLNDKSRFVVLWGMKAARWIVPAMLRNPAEKPDDLLNAVIKAATAHGVGMIGSPVVVEAYDALMLDALDANAKNKPTDKAIQTVIPYMQQLLQGRAQLYRAGTPSEPLAEQRGTLFLVDRRVWGLHSAAQKMASVQVMSDIIGLAAQQLANAAPEHRENLAIMIGRVAAALAVVPETQPVQGQLAAASKIDARTPADQIAAAVGGVAPALKSIKQFAALTPPPAIAPPQPATPAAPAAPAQAATQPTTAPTTSAPASTASATVGP